MSNIFFILVEPQLGENIGAVARVMSNFGHCHLRVINPRDGWPNQKALEMSAHGKFVLDQAVIYGNLQSAIQDINYLVATSANNRYLAKPISTPAAVSKKLKKQIDIDPAIKIGLLFGRERSGLTNEEISFADALVQINTAEINPSLNLAQAVCVLAYELSKSFLANHHNDEKSSIKASQGDLSNLLEHLVAELDRANFFQVENKRAGMIINIRNLIMRVNLSAQDVRTIRGMIKAIGRNKIIQ